LVLNQCIPDYFLRSFGGDWESWKNHTQLKIEPLSRRL
jgi:hypothetical protein